MIRPSHREPGAEKVIKEVSLTVTLPYWVGALPVSEIIRLRDTIRARRVAKTLGNGRKM